MHFFARAVITGFGFTLGALLLRKAAKQLGIDDPMYPSSVPAKPIEATPPGDLPQRH
jgi:hypothetical protein